MKLPFASEVPELDRATCERQGVSSYELMTRAAVELSRWFRKHLPSKETEVVLLAGPGNNGGDALVLVRLLREQGYDNARAYLVPSTSGRLSADCEHALLDAGEAAVRMSLQQELPAMGPEVWVVDALFGSGLNRPLEGIFGYMADRINQSEATVVSVDVPSGMTGEHGVSGKCVQADYTLTFTHPKLSMLFPEGGQYCGEVTVLDIGIDAEAIAGSASPYYIIKDCEIASLLKKRSRFSHKNNYGSALLVAGSRGMMGAALLAARACMRSGAGLLTVHVPACGYDIMQSGCPEAKCEPDLHSEHWKTLPDKETRWDAIAVGPGLGQATETGRALQELLQTTVRPMVIDADALNLIAAHPDWLTLIPRNSILTPHPGEALRLLKSAENRFLDWEAMPTDTSLMRLRALRTLAQKLYVNIVFKGTYTAVIGSDGSVSFNLHHGHPGMAVGGSGDTLTGILLALLAQHYEPREAAKLGVTLHSLAADLALVRESEESFLPSDLITCLGAAFKSLENHKNR